MRSAKVDFFVLSCYNDRKNEGELFMQNYIPRSDYLNFLIRYADKPIIKVVSGVRRSGKSTLFEIFKQHLLSCGVSQNQIIAVNFEDIAFEELKDYRALHSYICNKMLPDQMNYIFLDEIQHCPSFEKAVDSLFIKQNTDVYITGSNAYFMSGELATLLSGRYVELKILPLSFKEFCLQQPENLSLSEKYRRYITRSGFPYVSRFIAQDEDPQQYLQSLYDTIVYNDIVKRYKIADSNLLESVIRFLFDNIGNRLSSRKIAGAMTSAGRKIDAKTVEKYIKALTDSLLAYETKRYNIKGKEYLQTQEKYYITDVALRFMLLGGKNLDVGHVLENVVYLELLRRGFSVFVGQLDNGEVDFVAFRQNDTVYIQVSETVRDPSTLKRELAPLQSIADFHQKLLLTMDEDPDADYNGIKRLNVLDWLMGKYDFPASQNI